MPIDAQMLSPGQRWVPGILGGLGPLAHVQFEQQILTRNHLRGARTDRQHPVWLLASASSTPERTRAILEGGPSALPHLLEFAKRLEAAGADAIFVVCNTAHAYHADVQREIGIPWIHLMNIVAGAIRAGFPAGTGVGILGTDGTLATGLYHRALDAAGLRPVAPDVGSAVQQRIMSAIFDGETGIKATGANVSPVARGHLTVAAEWCVGRGAAVIVPACTEVSVGLTAEVFGAAPLVDPLVVAADVLLDLAYAARDPRDALTRPKA